MQTHVGSEENAAFRLSKENSETRSIPSPPPRQYPAHHARGCYNLNPMEIASLKFPPMPGEYYRRQAARVRNLALDATTLIIREHLAEVFSTRSWPKAPHRVSGYPLGGEVSLARRI
jgi:hypothetical protein